MRSVILSGAFCFLVAACAAPTVVADPPPTPPIVRVICIPMQEYTLQQQAELAAEMEDLQVQGKYKTVLQFLVDYKAMRDADRACKAQG